MNVSWEKIRGNIKTSKENFEDFKHVFGFMEVKNGSVKNVEIVSIVPKKTTQYGFQKMLHYSP